MDFFIRLVAFLLLLGKDPIVALALEISAGGVVLARSQRQEAWETGQHLRQQGEAVRGNLVEDAVGHVVAVDNELVDDASVRGGRQQCEESKEDAAREDGHR